MKTLLFGKKEAYSSLLTLNMFPRLFNEKYKFPFLFDMAADKKDIVTEIRTCKASGGFKCGKCLHESPEWTNYYNDIPRKGNFGMCLL
jgi:hypothetical protein